MRAGISVLCGAFVLIGAMRARRGSLREPPAAAKPPQNARSTILVLRRFGRCEIMRGVGKPLHKCAVVFEC